MSPEKSHGMLSFSGIALLLGKMASPAMERLARRDFYSARILYMILPFHVCHSGFLF